MKIFLDAAGPGEKLQSALGHEIGSLFLLVVIAFSLYYFWQRAFTKFLGFALFALAVSVLIFSPDFIKQFGIDLFHWLFDGWIQSLT
ncbi:hypothetical protein H1164_17130 [Thermoactinomyces daqus]|uniref:Uncharacterized protein n=1 Tax=Thermoactinomyces daqus TaxID=1329516 RepID=A0A7W1XDB1_9BACL|nr:hypothetical protein [Thermoactinomyces daqus]MBA4544555.1 hypothetical protein [Thermoactinomyces daqus]